VHNRFIPFEEAIELYRRATVVVLPYIDATSSGVIPLAFSCHRPVVATDVGTNRDFIEDGITGFLIPPRDVGALANAVINILQDKDLQTQMKENIVQRLRTPEMKWVTAANQTIKAYEKAVG